MSPAHDEAPASLNGLAGRLRDLRLATLPRISQTAAAKHIEASQNKVSRAENGEFLLSPAAVRKLAQLYGATRGETDQLVRWAEALRPERLDSRLIFQRGTNHFQKRVRDMEEASALVRSYQPGMILGAIQTQTYAETVMNQRPNAGASDAVRLRLTRGQMMLADPDREWVLIQTEGSLRWPVCSAEVMAEQLEHIIATSRRPNVRLGMVSQDQPVSFTAPHGFHIYDRQAVQIGTKTATALTSDPRDLAEYQELFARLEGAALWGDAARDVVERVATTYRGAQ